MDSPTYAAEMYLAAASVLDLEHATGKEWLGELGVGLQLDAELAPKRGYEQRL